MQYFLQGVTGVEGLYPCAININTGTRLNIVLEFIAPYMSVPASSRPKGGRAHRGHGIKPLP